MYSKNIAKVFEAGFFGIMWHDGMCVEKWDISYSEESPMLKLGQELPETPWIHYMFDF